MSYRKQRAAIKSGEPCDPVQMQEQLNPVAQELSGHVIDHNIAAGTFPQSRVSDACYYAVASSGGTPYYISVAATMGIETLPEAIPLSGSANAFRIPDTAEWNVVGSAGTGGALSRSMTTGESLLWIITQLQYAVVGAVPDPLDVAPSASADQYGVWERDSAHANLQFAIRVDGILLEDTITGLEDVVNPAPRGYYPEAPTNRAGGILGPGPFSIHTFRTSNVEGLGFPVYPLRIIAYCPVSEGSHTVEVVVRRLPPVATPANQTVAFPRGAPIEGVHLTTPGTTITPLPCYVYNRKLLVVDMHLQAPATGSTYSVEIPTLEEGNTVNVATTYTNSVAAIVAAENNLGDGAMARNALRNVHLPSRVLYPNQVGLDSANAPVTLAYPGFGVIGGTWYRINDGGGGPVYCETNSGPYDFGANPGFVILLGNVAVSTVSHANAAVLDRLYAWFTIQGVYQSGATFGNSSAEMAISNPNRLAYLAGAAPAGSRMDPIEADVPLFEFFDFRAAPPAGGVVARFAILGGNSWNPVATQPPFPTVNIRKSNIAMLCLKK